MNSNKTSTATPFLGLYTATRRSSQRITNHDKIGKYLTNIIARKKFKFASTSEVTFVG